MTFAAPLYLFAAAVAAAVVVGLHFLARQRPAPAPLPTARFVPDRHVRAPSLSSRPSDLVLLLTRVLALLSVGIALAGPRPAYERATLRIVMLDRSRAVQDAAEADDSASRWVRPGDVLVEFDTVAGPTPERPGQQAAPASLSAALIAAIRTARGLSDRADSVELVIISAFAVEGWDAATADLRALWPGRARLLPVRTADAAGSGAVPARPASATAGGDDPVQAALGLTGTAARTPAARLVRDHLTAADSAWAREGGTLVWWPREPVGPTDTSGAVLAGGHLMTGPFRRTGLTSHGHTVARWVDGAPAAIERPLGAGCVREVGIVFPASGDAPLRANAGAVVHALSAPCGGLRRTDPLDPARLDILAGAGGLADANAFGGGRGPGPSAPWLVAALFLLGIEAVIRRRAA